MGTTPNIGLTTKNIGAEDADERRIDTFDILMGSSQNSNMMIIDREIGDIQGELGDIDTILDIILGS